MVLGGDEVQKFIRIHTTREEVQIRGKLNSKSKNVLYILTCNKDGLQYEGRQARVQKKGLSGTETLFCYQGTDLSMGKHFRSSGIYFCGTDIFQKHLCEEGLRNEAYKSV